MSAIKSIVVSFFPLLATILLCQIIMSGIIAFFVIVVFLVVKFVNFVGFQYEYSYSSPFFVGCILLLIIFLLLILVYLQVNWVLVAVVVVVESSWGFKALKRSKYLVKGYSFVALSQSSCFAFLVGILIWSSSDLGTHFGGISKGWSWAFVLQIVIASTLLMLLFLYNIAANTLLYMYCKAIHGELAMEIAEEFAEEYVSLPFDNGKVPHLVSAVYNGY